MQDRRVVEVRDMDEFRVTSTSLRSADVDDFPLRETTTTRLVFRAELVENPKDPDAGVRGWLVYQRKTSTGLWEDLTEEKLSQLRAGDGIKLLLKSGEVKTLYDYLSGLYQVHRRDGVPMGEVTYVQGTGLLRDIVRMEADVLRNVVNAEQELGTALLGRLLRWALETDQLPAVLDYLTATDSRAVLHLGAAVNLKALQQALDEWRVNRNSTDEEKWQELFTKHSFVLEQIFSVPTVVVQGKAYVGGKITANTHGNIVDFLVRQSSTGNAGLIEIKTPGTDLLGPVYRTGIYNISRELSGAIMQVLNYRHTLTSEAAHLSQSNGLDFRCFEPKCYIIAGNVENELDDNDKKRSFELLRNSLTHVTIVSYDELFDRLERLVTVLSEVGEDSNGN